MCDHIRCEEHGGFTESYGALIQCSIALGESGIWLEKRPPVLGGPTLSSEFFLLLVSNAQKWKTEQEEMKKGANE